jgi:hypothetical protein
MQRLRDSLVRDLEVVEVGLHQLVVVVGAGLDQVGASVVRRVGQRLRDLGVLELGAELVLPDLRLVLDQVDDALEALLGADRKLDRQRIRSEPVPHRLDRLLVVGAGAIHLVDEGDPRYLVLIGLAPDRLRLRLNPGHGVEQGDGSVEHAQGAFDLDGEVDMARRVDDVDPMLAPLACGCRRGDRDAPFLLLLHPVHDGGAFVNLAHLVGAAGVVEDALGRRRLAGVDVRHDPDVAGLL